MTTLRDIRRKKKTYNTHTKVREHWAMSLEIGFGEPLLRQFVLSPNALQVLASGAITVSGA